MTWMPQSLLSRLTTLGQKLHSTTTMPKDRMATQVSQDRPAASIPISFAEWRFVGLVTFALLILTSLPYLFALFSAPADKQFMGFIINVDDHTQYLSWYKAFQTEHIISNRLTSEPNPPLFFNLLWWSLGRFGYYTGLSYIVVYQIFRWVASAFFLVMVYVTATLFFSTVAQRRAAFLIIAMGAGLGWGLVVIKYIAGLENVPMPNNLYISEGNTFLCMLGYPHFAEAAGLILAVFYLLLIGEQRQQLRYAVYAGLVSLLLGWQHTYDLIIVWGIPTIYGGTRWLIDRRWPMYWFKAMLIVGLLSFSPALYSVWLTSANPLWEAVLAQFSNAGVFSPRPLQMLILMGVPLIVAIIVFVVALQDVFKRRMSSPFLGDKEVFLGIWFIVGWAMVYIPTDYQVHMISSWQVPIGFLATMGLFRYLIPMLERRWNTARLAQVVVLLFLCVIIPTNLYLLAWRFVDLRRSDYPYFFYRDEVAAMEWLENEPANSVVLSAYEAGRYIPGLSGQRVFLGHWAQTVDFWNKRELVEAFFAEGADDERRLQMIHEYGIEYVFYGQAERALGSYAPDESEFLTAVFTTPQAQIYAVIDQ